MRRAIDAIADGDVAGAVSELETLLPHVEKREGRKIAAAASQVSGSVRASIDALLE